MKSHLLAALSALMLSACGGGHLIPSSAVDVDALANKCFAENGRRFNAVMLCSKKANDQAALSYRPTGTTMLGEVQVRSYRLDSQRWQAGDVSPSDWHHCVELYQPPHPRRERALLVISNGVNTGTASFPVRASSDFSAQALAELASKTNSIIVTVSDVPNQFLTFADSPTPRREDDAVAHSWQRFLANPEQRPFASLHIPMMVAAVKAMDLAQAELVQFGIRSFIATGASKRGWTTWHTALVDSRIDAMVPFVIDILNTKVIFEHTKKVYGGSWPLALKPYADDGVIAAIGTPAFDKLMEIEDPLRYQAARYAARMAIPKYLINTSGDSFFTPDNAALYFDQLPGPKVLWSVPNADHFQVLDVAQQALINFTNRIQSGIALPVVSETLSGTSGAPTSLTLAFNEPATKITRWVAINPAARDFRAACGVKYAPSEVKADADGKVRLDLATPPSGWSATFAEIQFADGFTATSKVYVTPNGQYPQVAPTAGTGACQTFP
ncbi:PhoPQ-activated protein PqaA family protein [Duganella violaceipulchra]|uniref:PhoPQ-activated pathogenicity-related protein n=1 Tax=Duganella violaceipulchra TaxID=2849652 RepID=A0AA41HE58_9BURK|nr:PhoPQ-activated protein PqaA family protein [Duganella violaceicalia]MBV6322491.1 PhoPQ-regulated protein [Duganella violaceicalia]MCP2010699.1 PhoPQ-activated pathogenicity-related protein [Duganella violaceicalia]